VCLNPGIYATNVTSPVLCLEPPAFATEGIRVISVDPGDMDTALHAIAVPDADPSVLKRPEAAARELVGLIADVASRPGATSIESVQEVKL